MHKRNISDYAAAMQQHTGSISKNEESESDDGSNYDVNNSAFLSGDTFDRYDNKSDGKEEINVMVPANSDKYACAQMLTNNMNLLIGCKWDNITPGEM
eukprot:4588926-Ditylum_brightwellii.AAC.1